MNKYFKALKNLKRLGYENAGTITGDEILNEVEILEESILKTIPKGFGLRIEEVDGVRIGHAICPNCKKDMEKRYPYCPYCMQAID